MGDWVLVHVGFAIQKLDEDYALEILELFEELLEREDELSNSL
ncbi:MAG: HypC/HybG/HupF family hydrogenase formation chaperone [Aquificaceae bacterium]|nr:HypC/HybG/HupF family hydrogenase formation chaperone [Aquificaceae bacterium]MDW8096336.1 HypC/HybG/HupF family hydrogenase formation chaperone [Aquificaceae bacterium]